MDELNTDNGDAGAPEAPATEPDLGDTLRDLVEARGDKLGDGAPPPEEESDEVAAPAPASAPEPAKAPDTTPGWQRPPDLNVAPESWKPEIRAAWAALPEAVRAEVYRREQDSARGFAEIKPFVESGKRFSEAMKPFEQEFRQYNVDPVALFSNLAQAHRTLSLGTPEQKAQAFAQLSQQYRIPLPKGDGGDPSFGEPGWVDPEVKALRDRMERIESERQAELTRAAEQRRAQVTQEVTAFSKDPANLYFEEVVPEIARLAQADPSLTLKDAYDKACWLVPSVREKLVAAEAEKTRKAQEVAERKRAEDAAASRGGPPRSTARQAGATAKTGTMDDTLKETFATILARSK